MSRYKQCPKKVEINQLFSSTAKDHLQKQTCNRSKVLILDTEELHTSNMLRQQGIPFSQICAPNPNSKIAEQLKKAGIDSHILNIEEYLKHVKEHIPVFWYDGMTSITGNKNNGWYPCVAIDTYLKRELGGNNPLIAVTISTHNNKGNIHGYTQKILLQNQMEAIFDAHDYSYKLVYLENYKLGMCFGMWELMKSHVKKKHQPIAMEDESAWVGFPKNYNTFHLGWHFKK